MLDELFSGGGSSALDMANFGMDLSFGVYDRAVGNKQYSRSHDLANDIAKKKYRWAVKDMYAAGLNPILAMTKGISAGGPTGPGQSYPAPMNATAKGLERAQAELARKQREVQDAEIGLKGDQGGAARAAAARDKAQAELLAEQMEGVRISNARERERMEKEGFFGSVFKPIRNLLDSVQQESRARGKHQADQYLDYPERVKDFLNNFDEEHIQPFRKKHGFTKKPMPKGTAAVKTTTLGGVKYKTFIDKDGRVLEKRRVD